MPECFCNVCPITEPSEGPWKLPSPPERLIWNSTPCPGIRRDPYSSSGCRNDTNVSVLGVSATYGGWGWWQGENKHTDNIRSGSWTAFPLFFKDKLMHRLLLQMFSQSKRHFERLTAHFTLPQSLLGLSHTLKRWKLQKLDKINRITDEKWKTGSVRPRLREINEKGNRTYAEKNTNNWVDMNLSCSKTSFDS